MRAGSVTLPPSLEGRPVGLTYDGRIGRYLVRFLFILDEDGTPHSAAFWVPDRPKRLKPHHLKKYRRERRALVSEVARQFDLAFHVIDRMDGQPRVSELVYEDGAVEAVGPPVPYPGVH